MLFSLMVQASLQSPQMLCVSDITDVIMPLPEDLLVNLQVALPSDMISSCISIQNLRLK